MPMWLAPSQPRVSPRNSPQNSHGGRTGGSRTNHAVSGAERPSSGDANEQTKKAPEHYYAATSLPPTPHRSHGQKDRPAPANATRLPVDVATHRPRLPPRRPNSTRRRSERTRRTTEQGIRVRKRTTASNITTNLEVARAAPAAPWLPREPYLGT